jgi:hypothetical protein
MAPHPCIDDTERGLASGQLDELALIHEGCSWAAWKEAVLTWHLHRFATAQSEAWLPGLVGGDTDPAVSQLLGRFHHHHMQLAIRRLRAENVALRRRLVDTTECARFYATGAVDGGERAGALLGRLRAATPVALPDAARLTEPRPTDVRRFRQRNLPTRGRGALS